MLGKLEQGSGWPCPAPSEQAAELPFHPLTAEAELRPAEKKGVDQHVDAMAAAIREWDGQRGSLGLKLDSC